eukprot:TRINITY_DN65024_c0_g1_i1.p1 TRINITY_DN65024_c0_g1~~TRINITY_DN65024_c0_g1_i1.p1  ORF type:complete len:329 (+),score=74.50 TRINITY_DN65024_c0_g1_i1:100-1086(+)
MPTDGEVPALGRPSPPFSGVLRLRFTLAGPGLLVAFEDMQGGHPSADNLRDAVQSFFRLQHLRRLREALVDNEDNLDDTPFNRHRGMMGLPTGLDEMMLRSAITISLQQQQPSGPPPATKEDIAKLPSHRITGWDLAQPEMSRDCAVCLEPFTRGALATRLPCRHCFCPDCIREWLGHHGTCPTCRAAVRDLPSPRAGADHVGRPAAEAAPAPGHRPLHSPMAGTPVQGLLQRRNMRIAADEAADSRSSTPPQQPPAQRVPPRRAAPRRSAAGEPEGPPQAQQQAAPPPAGRPAASGRRAEAAPPRHAAGSGTAWARGTTNGLGSRRR